MFASGKSEATPTPGSPDDAAPMMPACCTGAGMDAETDAAIDAGIAAPAPTNWLSAASRGMVAIVACRRGFDFAQLQLEKPVNQKINPFDVNSKPYIYLCL